MLTIRCKMVVQAAFEELRLRYKSVELGEIVAEEQLSEKDYMLFKTILLKSGLELIDDRKMVLVEKVKIVIVEMVHYADELPVEKISVYISRKLNYDYTYLSNIFSEVKGITIKQFVILHKIEKIKELMVYDELNLTQIANKLHYSSVGHLSRQFKQVTGYTPSYFRLLKNKRRRTLDDI